MVRGFANEGRPFDIESAAYLKEPMREIRRRPHGKFVIKAAVQMLKTNGMIEQPSGYFIANDPGDMVIYLSGDSAAFDQAKSRAMPYLKANPQIAKMIDAVRVQGPDGRFQITTDVFYLPGMVLRIWPLNITTTQRMTLRYVFISDAFLSQKTGLIKEAIARTTQHNTHKIKDYKIILESQGSEEGDDFDEEWKTTDQRMLSVVCPLCGMGQIFEWYRQRPEDFIATPPKTIPSLDHAAWISHFTPILKSEDRRNAGMKRGDEATVKSDDVYSEKEIIRQTYYECYHCGETWHDKEETRRLLDHSSHYIPTNDRAKYEDVGWSWPAWGGQRVPWGDIMLEYLRAKQAQRMGNILSLKIWHQKRKADVWKASSAYDRVTELSAGSYDPGNPNVAELIPNEHSRDMVVDCQEDKDHKEKTGASITGWFWFVARVFDKFGNSKQIARGYCKSWDAWIAVQKYWKIPNDRVMVDCLFDPEGVLKKAIECREVVKLGKPHPIFKTMERTVTWKLLASATRQTNFKHPDGVTRPWSTEMRNGGYVIDPRTNKPKWVDVPKVMFNKDPIRFQVDALYTGAPGVPKFEVLGREHLKLPDGSPDLLTLEMETGLKTYQNQMSAQHFDMQKNKYIEERPDDHYYWCEQGLLVRVGMDGLLGATAVFT